MQLEREVITGDELRDLFNKYGTYYKKEFIPHLIKKYYPYFNAKLFEDDDGLCIRRKGKKHVIISPDHSSFDDLAEQLTNLDIKLKIILAGGLDPK